MMTLLFMIGAPSGAEGGGSGNMIQSFGFMALIFVVFWFFMIRPQRQKQKQRESMLKALKKGDRIVTIGGIRGAVAKVNENNTVVVKIDDNCKIEFSRSAIAEVVLDDKEIAARKSQKNDEKNDEKKAEDKKVESKEEEKGAL